jgi:hypothetical protein
MMDYIWKLIIAVKRISLVYDDDHEGGSYSFSVLYITAIAFEAFIFELYYSTCNN